MSFLDHFSTELQERLLQGGAHSHVPEGQTLLHRGEQGGDLYLVESGAFEVIDNRSHPEIVLDVIRPGAVLGEMTFIDDAPRAADVRAATDSEVIRWQTELLRARFDADPELAAAFYRAVARTMADRFRSFSHTVAAGGLSSGGGVPVNSSDAAQAHELASEILEHWVDAEDRLRRDPNDRRGKDLVAAGMKVLFGDASRWLASLEDDARRQGCGTLMRRELRPYLSRSITGERMLDALGHVAGDPRLLAHVIRGVVDGSSEFGRCLDAALLQLPSMEAVRARSAAFVGAAREAIPEADACRLLVINPHCGLSVVGMLMSLSVRGGHIHIVDSSRTVLSTVDLGLPRRPPNVGFSFAQVDLAAAAAGRIEDGEGDFDIVLLDSLVDHLPDQLVVRLADWARTHLRPGGSLLVGGLAPSSDELVLDHVLGWPLVRRTPTSLKHLVAGRQPVRGEVLEGPEGHSTASTVVRVVNDGGGDRRGD